MRLVAADEAGGLEVAPVLDLADDVVLAGPAVRVVGDREGGLDHGRVGVGAVLRGEDHDAAGGVRVGDLEVGQVHRVAAADDDLGPRPVLPTCARMSSSISTLSRSARITMVARAARLVGDAELADDREDLRAPAEDQRVVGLEHLRAALAQRLRPCCRSAPEMMPIRLATMMRPPMVTTSIATRKPQPSSPPMVPLSRVRIRLPQSISQKSGASGPSRLRGRGRRPARRAPRRR